MPKLKCPICEHEWNIPGRILDYDKITHYPKVWCPNHKGLVTFAKIIEK